MLLESLTNITAICMTHRPVFHWVRHNFHVAWRPHEHYSNLYDTVQCFIGFDTIFMLLGALTNITVICMTHRLVFHWVRHNFPLAIVRMSAVSLLVTRNVQNLLCSSEPGWTLTVRQDSCIFRCYKRNR